MKNISLSFLFFLLTATLGFSQVEFDRYFKDKTLRIDYHHSGNATSETIELDSVFPYGIWAGSKVNLIDEFDYGQLRFKIVDKESQKLIYSKGFDTYFKEYQTTEAAIAGESKSYYEVALSPYPLKPFYFVLEKRDSINQFEEFFRTELNPDSNISDLKLDDKSVKVTASFLSGTPDKKVDILIIGDGYTASEMDKFESDLARATVDFFEVEPLKSLSDRFNVRGVFKPSEESGVTEPDNNIVRKTALNSTFGSLGTDRYLLTEDLKSVHDLAAYAPSDAIVIMVNSQRYGGGGIYNFYSTFTSDNISSAFLFVHEFGHSFFGLGDEYYSSSTSYTDFYPKGIEPLAPNITANTDKETLKWKHLLTEPIDIPTYWPQAAYDSSQAASQAKSRALHAEIDELIKAKAPTERINSKKAELHHSNTTQLNFERSILTDSRYAGKVGAFEGAGYAAEDLYRPSITCIMLTREKHFCPVCADAMIKMIDSVSKH